MRRLGWVLQCFLLVIPLSSAHGDDSQLWTALGAEKKLDDKFSVLGEFNYRQSKDVNDFVVMSNRLGVGYKAIDTVKLAYIFESRTTDSSKNNEVRNIFQITQENKFEHFKLGFRGRWELRRFADSPAYMNRFRLLAKVDLNVLKFYDWTPLVSTEMKHISNGVGSRQAGSQEYRVQVGLSRPLLGGKFEIAYMDRRTTKPSTPTTPKSEEKYHVVVTSLKFDLD